MIPAVEIVRSLTADDGSSEYRRCPMKSTDDEWTVLKADDVATGRRRLRKTHAEQREDKANKGCR